MIRKLLLLLVMMLVFQMISFGQGAEILANCFYQSATQRIVVRIALKNPTGSSTGQMEFVGMRFGIQFNAAAVTYDGFKSYMYNLTNPGLDDANYLDFMGPDTGTNPADIGVESSPTRLAVVDSPVGTKTMQRRYINRSTNDCTHPNIINAGETKILIDIYFTLLNNNPEYYHLNEPGGTYGWGDPEFIAQFLTKNDGGHDGNLKDDHKEIAIVIIREGNTGNTYQPFDLKSCKSGNLVDPITVNGSNVNFINPINGVLSGKIQSFLAAEKNNNIQLDWKVENNELVDHYELERKDENGEFKTIAMIMSDNKYSTTSYQYTDKITAREQQLYYRVKTVGLDQIITYSDVKTIKLRSVQQPNIKVYPNPSSDVIRIDLPIANGAYVCRFYNSEGRMVKVENMSFPNASIHVNTLVNGNYFVELYHPQSGKRFYSQFTKQ